MKHLVLTASLLALTACATQGPSSLPGAQITMPAAYDYAPEITAIKTADEDWWTGFDSAALDELVTEALAANHTLAAGLANVRFLPQAGASGSASSDTGNGLDDISASARLSASYQLDLFGANAASRAASVANLDAAIFDQRALEREQAVR